MLGGDLLLKECQFRDIIYELMKPVRVVQDIVRRKTVASGDKANFSATIRKVASFKIPLFIWLAIVLVEAVSLAKLAPQAVSYRWVAQFADAFTNVVPAPQKSAVQETAVAQNIVAAFGTSTAPASTTNETSSDISVAVQAGLLPTVQQLSFATTTAATSTKKTVAHPSPSPSKPAAPSVVTQTVITAKSLLDAATINMNERYDGPYKISFTTSAGTYGNITWDLTKTELAVAKSVPTFSISSSCDPAPDVAAADALDQNPTFDPRTSYTCTVVLTPNSGSDQRPQSKQFSFTTGAGQLIVTPSPTMDDMLEDGINTGGFIFRNDDSEPATITGLTVDVSYTGLNTANIPLILSFLDPVTNNSLYDYHLENLAANSSSSYSHAGTNVTMPVSFTIGAMTQKMLPVSILGVTRFHVYGVDPNITITLRGVTTNQNLSKVLLSTADISWSCIIPLGAYDPNATSGPYATGQACK